MRIAHALAWLISGATISFAAPVAAAGAASTGAPSPGEAPPQTIAVEVRGPIALVQIDRPVELGRAYGTRSSDEVVLDLALPPGARVQAVELQGGAQGARVRLRPQADGLAGYQRLFAATEWRRARVNDDDAGDFRLGIAGARMGDGARAAQIRLVARYVAPLSCEDGRLVLNFPASLDAPAPAAVKVKVDLGDGGPGVGQLTVGGAELLARPRGARFTSDTATVPTLAPWQIAITPATARRPRPTGVVLAALTAGRGREPGTAVATICRASANPASPTAATAKKPEAMRGPTKPPERIVFLIDRSRSMGPEGVAAAGALSRALALGLPPGTRFSAVFFDRDSEALSPVLRTPTHEALAALESAASGTQLRNGTRLVPALARVQRLLEEDAPRGARVDAWVVLLTDAAFPDDHTAASLRSALASPVFAATQFASIILRGLGEERPAPFALKTLAALAAHRGGLLREIPVVGAADRANELLAALAGGGDLLDLRPRGQGVVGLTFDQLAVAPQRGSLAFGRWRGGVEGATLGFRGVLAGKTVSFPAATVSIDSGWAEAIAALAVPTRALPPWTILPESSLLPASDTGAIQPMAAVFAPPPLPVAEAVERRRGQLDRDILHKALTYTFLPRARACYLGRTARSAADFRLAGRLRLELQIERGEMLDAVVSRSSLGKPEIEACLREAAFTVDIPRPVLNDAPAIAAFNLVFRPRTDADAGKPGKADPAQAELDNTLAEILGPQAPAGDPMELLLETPSPEPPGPGDDASRSPSGRP
ncbi:MAG TPA: VWA domain-containing protein [Polyangia bacterium]